MSNRESTINSKQYANNIIIPQFVKMIDEGHTITFKLRGISMRPFLEDCRDKVVLRKPQEPKVGDAVLAEISKGVYVLHRIVKIKGNDIVLQGDGNLSTERCKRNDIRAVAEAFYRKGHTNPDYTAGWKWRIYSFIWMHLLPIRRYLLFIDRRLFKNNKQIEMGH